jgi:hypothetical protein
MEQWFVEGAPHGFVISATRLRQRMRILCGSSFQNSSGVGCPKEHVCAPQRENLGPQGAPSRGLEADRPVTHLIIATSE